MEAPQIRARRISRLTAELRALQEQKKMIELTSENWWKLDAQVQAIQAVLTNLTSLCYFCGQENAEIKLTQYFLCRSCLMMKKEEYALEDLQQNLKNMV